MARRKDETADGEAPAPVEDPTGTASALLVRQMEACERSMQACLDVWEAKKDDADSDEAEYFLDKAGTLAGATARLAEALARIKGESNQRIREERILETRENGADGAPLSPRARLIAGKKPVRSSQDEGEGGDAKA